MRSRVSHIPVKYKWRETGEILISYFSYAGSFLTFSYACVWLFYVFFFSYRKAYFNKFLNV